MKAQVQSFVEELKLKIAHVVMETTGVKKADNTQSRVLEGTGNWQHQDVRYIQRKSSLREAPQRKGVKTKGENHVTEDETKFFF